MRIHSDVFLYDSDEEFTLRKLEDTNKWVLRVDMLGIFMEEKHINQILNLIGKEFWNFDAVKLVDPEEEILNTYED